MSRIESVGAADGRVMLLMHAKGVLAETPLIFELGHQKLL
jgi:hypothetical protein